MMKASGRTTVCCAALILVLTSVSAVQRLDSINDLKRINFGQSVPKHGLVLLHWFANTVTIDSDDVIWPNFNPNCGDYGSHYYRNYEGLLDVLTGGNTRYYTVGNIHLDTTRLLPSHVVRPRPEYAGRNRARIIIRVREQNFRNIIDEVYITQHYETSDHQGTDYDPDHTYLVTTNLLREIRQFSMNGDQWLLTDLRNRFGSSADDSQLRSIISTWGHLACLGLLLHIVAQEGIYSNQVQHRPQQQRKAQQDQLQYRLQSATRSNVLGNICAFIGKLLLLFVFILFALAILILVA